MKFPYKSGLILLLFLVTISTIQENSNVYPARERKRTVNCSENRKSSWLSKLEPTTDLTRPGRRKSPWTSTSGIPDCAALWKGEVAYPSITYQTLNVNEFSQIDIAGLERQTDQFVEMIPQVTYFVGPTASPRTYQRD